METKKSSRFKGAVAAAVITAFTGACAETVKGIERDFAALTQSGDNTLVQELKQATQGYDSKTSAEKAAVQDKVYGIVFKQNADRCEFAVSTMVTNSENKHTFIGAIEAPEKGMYRIALHPKQVQLLVDGYSVDSNVTEGQFKGRVRVDYGNGSGAYHGTANFAPGTISKDNLIRMAQRAGQDFRSTDIGFLALINPNIHLPENVWVNVPAEVAMAGLYTREVTTNVDPKLKKLDSKYRGTAPIGGGISIFALTDGSVHNLERVGSGLPGGYQLNCKGPKK